MRRRNSLSHTLQDCMLGVESLEDRWLLSGPPAPAPSQSGLLPAAVDRIASSIFPTASDPRQEPGGAVEVVNFGVAPDDERADVEFTPSQIPKAIVAAIDSRFPGATLSGAELTTEVDPPVYEVSARWGGHAFDVALTLDGDIIETKQSLVAGELPQALLDWVGHNFPQAVIDEAELVTRADSVSYDLRLSVTGERDFEATLRVQDLATQISLSQSSQKLGVGPDHVLANSPSAMAELPGLACRTVGTSEVESSDNGAAALRSAETASPRGLAQQSSYEQAESQRADAIRPITESDPSEGVSSQQAPVAQAASRSGALSRPKTGAAPALVASSANADSTQWFPQVGGILSDVLPVDIAAVERGIQRILDGIGAMTATVASDSALTSSALRLAIVAALFTGADLVLLHSKKPDCEPVLDSNPANSSWSWVLGAATPRRP